MSGGEKERFTQSFSATNYCGVEYSTIQVFLRMKTKRQILKLVIPFLLLTTGVVSLPGSTDTVLILHTNDIHDHVRPDYDGSGGLPYVSGYINSIRNRRDDVLVLDAGDVAEKGDRVAFATQSKMSYEGLARIGYHAGAPGNHEHDFVGISGLKKFETLAGGMKLLCINLIDEQGDPHFEPSAIFDIDGVKVGVIGMIVPRKENCLDAEATALAMAQEAERLEGQVDLTVATCHYGSDDCATISRVAPKIDVFISGHSHEVIHESIRVPETGAIIVQAGSYAEYVGRLELTIDLDTKEILDSKSELVSMVHDTIPVDVGMLEWIRQQELMLTPDASRIIAWTDVPVGYAEIGQLAATALREYGNVDIGFCAAGQVVRAKLPVGVLDVNAFFRTGGERGFRIIQVSLTGSEINAYINGMKNSDWFMTLWSGLAARELIGADGSKVMKTNLNPNQLYQVVMPELEWTTRFQRLVQRAREQPNLNHLKPLAKGFTDVRITGYSFTDAVCTYVESSIPDGEGLLPHIEILSRQAQL